jgi:hypothetical protein
VFSSKMVMLLKIETRKAMRFCSYEAVDIATEVMSKRRR